METSATLADWLTGWLLIGWGSWSQRTAGVSQRDNVEVPPHSGRIGSHPLIRNPSISLQLQQIGTKTEIPGLIPTRTVWKPHLHWLVADWPELMQPTRGEVAPRDNVEAPSHPRSIGSHPRIRNLSISLQRQQIGDENADPSGRYRLAWCGNLNPTG